MQWIGRVGPDDVAGYLTSCDVAVAPYPNLSDFYFSPLKVYEYMACGLPTVASSIGQLQSMITHGIDGFLIEPASVTALANTLIMLAEEPGLRAKVSRASGQARRRGVLLGSGLGR